jgi:hypothetical protein
MFDPVREIQSLTMEKKGEAPKALNWAEEAVRLCERNAKLETRALTKEIKTGLYGGLKGK